MYVTVWAGGQVSKGFQLWTVAATPAVPILCSHTCAAGVRSGERPHCAGLYEN